MSLIEMAARKAKPREKAYKLADADGLYLPIQPGGSKLWCMKYHFSGKYTRCIESFSRRPICVTPLTDGEGKAKSFPSLNPVCIELQFDCSEP